MSENKSKRYFFNNNAIVHARALVAFFIMSNATSMSVSGVFVMMILRNVPMSPSETVVLLAVAMLGWLLAAAAIFLTITNSYASLIESQVINPPAPPKETIIHKRMYSTPDGGWKEAGK